MNKLFARLVLAVLLLVSGAAIAQAPSNDDVLIGQRTVHLTAEQTHVIKEIVLKDMNVAKAPGNTQVKIGAVAPRNVELLSFPSTISGKVSQIKTHKFFVTGNRIVIVNSQDNIIADIIE